MDICEVLRKLPAVMVGSTVFEFLTIADIVQLHSSCYSQSSHMMFLEAARCSPPKDVLNLKKDTKRAVAWLLKCNFKIGRVTVDCDHSLILGTMTGAIGEMSDVVQEIELSFSDSELVSITNYDLKLSEKITVLVLHKMHEVSHEHMHGLHNLKALTCNETPINSAVLELVEDNPNLSKLHVSHRKCGSNKHLSAALVLSGPGLTDLTVDKARFSEMVTLVGAHCLRLQNLTLTETLMFYEPAVELDMTPVADGCPQLVRLHLVGIRPAQGSLRKVLNQCKYLRVLVAPDTPLGDIFADDLPTTETESEAALPEHLVELTVDSGMESMPTEHADQSLFAHMEAFSVRVSSVPSVPMVVGALNLMTSLTSLILKLAYCIDHDSVAQLFDALINHQLLTQLVVECDMDDVKSESLCRLIASLPQLEVLESQVSDATLVTLAQSCPKLHTLRCSSCSVIDAPAVVEALAHGCPQLRHLDISFCNALTDAHLQVLQTQCPGLESLQLDDCSALTQHAVVNLVRHCRRLRKLRVHGGVLPKRVAEDLCRSVRGLHIDSCEQDFTFL